MRKRARIDGNHAEIVKALKQYGATVHSLATIGDGCPDILVGYAGKNILMEIKMPKCKKTPDENRWHDTWNGRVFTVYSVSDAILSVREACSLLSAPRM